MNPLSGPKTDIWEGVLIAGAEHKTRKKYVSAKAYAESGRYLLEPLLRLLNKLEYEIIVWKKRGFNDRIGRKVCEKEMSWRN